MSSFTVSDPNQYMDNFGNVGYYTDRNNPANYGSDKKPSQKKTPSQQQAQSNPVQNAINGQVIKEALKETFGSSSSEIPANAIGQNADGSFIFPEAGAGTEGGFFSTPQDMGGSAVAAVNMFDALGNFKGDRKGITEGLFTTGGTVGGGIIGSAFGMPGVGAGVGSVIGRTTGRLYNSAFKELGLDGWRKSTKDYQAERWGNVSKGSQGWADYYAKNQEDRKNNPNEGYWTAEQDPTGKYVGKKWSWDSMQDIAKTTGNYKGFIGVLGNAETFGDKWLSTPEDKQLQVVQELVNQGLYKSDKGDVLISDRDKAKAQAIYDQIMGAQPPQGEVLKEAIGG